MIRLKDTSKDLIECETLKMLNDLGLENKSENYSTELSGGMKRKLSVAIAFIGNSTTVILDEPTAGREIDSLTIDILIFLSNRCRSICSTSNMGSYIKI